MPFSYYHATKQYAGDTATFEPQGYYEKAIEISEGCWTVDVFRFDDYAECKESDVREICFARSPHACLFGMARFVEPGRYYIYGTNERPDVDLSGECTILDFNITGEVRYRRPVAVTLVGMIHVDNRLNRLLHRTLKRCHHPETLYYDLELAQSVLDVIERRVPLVQPTGRSPLVLAGV